MSHLGKVLIRRRVWLTSTGGLPLEATKADTTEPYPCSSFTIGPPVIRKIYGTRKIKPKLPVGQGCYKGPCSHLLSTKFFGGNNTIGYEVTFQIAQYTLKTGCPTDGADVELDPNRGRKSDPAGFASISIGESICGLVVPLRRMEMKIAIRTGIPSLLHPQGAPQSQ